MRIMKVIVIVIFLPISLILLSSCQNNYLVKEQIIEIGTFNIEWFPCKDDGQLMKKYGIELRYPPEGQSTDMIALSTREINISSSCLAIFAWVRLGVKRQ